MKVTIIEGSPEELADYEARVGAIGSARAITAIPDPSEEAVPVGDGQLVGGTDSEDKLTRRSFIYGRARKPIIAGYVESYIDRVLDLGEAEVEIGTSKASKDGRADYMLIYPPRPRWYGAVSYVNAKNGGLTLRLTRDDVADVDTDPRIRQRNVQPGNEYQINCPLASAAAIDLAVKLTQRALAKVRMDAASNPANAEPTPSASKVEVGGVLVSAEELASAISILKKNSTWTAVKQPLAAQGHPLAAMDYHAVADAELQAHPELKLSPGTKSKHEGRVKVAVLHHLEAKLAELTAGGE